MAQDAALMSSGEVALPEGLDGVVDDWSADKQTFIVPWGKAMMWIFLLSDTFIFSCFLIGYMKVRSRRPVPWPNPSEVFALSLGGAADPADPDCDHDVYPDYQQRHDGDGGEFRLPPRSRKTALLMMATALWAPALLACRPSSGPS